MKRDDAYLKTMSQMTLAYPGEHKGAQATARALMGSDEALRGAYAVAGLVATFHAALLTEGLDERQAFARAAAMLSLVEYVIGNMIDEVAAQRFVHDYNRAAEALT